MAWTGKIIGGVLGSFIGPWGTAIGIGIGHQFDKGASRVQTAGMMMQVAFFGCLAKMAKADGAITKQEIAAVEQIIARLGYTPKMREAAIDIFRQAKDDPHTAADYIGQLAAVIRFNPQLGMTFIAALHAVAQADGLIHPNERDILLQAERAFRLQPGTIDAMLGGGRTDNLADAYKVLECTPEMSDAEIKKIYREKCVQFHPDKLASKGLPDEFMKFAHEQLAKVNDAYDTIKKSRA
ncbi:MAG: TerB family tellurite resistance protein [Kiritimatiellales bacterium]|nr:TerB family tellurite resistance protein [Kiritimatiellales bacterium]